MPEKSGLITLAERKRLLVQQADAQRTLLVTERRRLQDRLATAREQLSTHRWWLLGGAAAVGWLAAGRLGGVRRWLPVAFGAMRIVRSLRR
jgi:cytochrome c-type biogenesis protein CcmH/NrfG